MKISTKGRYGLVIMLNLAKEYKNDNFISLNDIANKENISLKYLEKIMTRFKGSDYFITSRGVSGGYKLKYEPSKYKIGDILRIAEGNIDVTECVKHGFNCPSKSTCKTYNVWNDLNNSINSFLDSKTLADYI